jgi:ribosomal subunit interface protein
MDVTVRGRHLDVPEKFHEHAGAKLARLTKYDPKLSAIDVQVAREQNPRAADPIRVEITCRGTRPIVRAEASASDKYAAFDVAVARLEERLRRAHDKRLSRTHHRTPLSRALPVADAPVAGESQAADDAGPKPLVEAIGDGPLVVREKFHDDTPITVEDALDHMELVGHDFYLFMDKENGMPSVVYRRRGYDYGVLRLAADPRTA